MLRLCSKQLCDLPTQVCQLSKWLLQIRSIASELKAAKFNPLANLIDHLREQKEFNKSIFIRLMDVRWAANLYIISC